MALTQAEANAAYATPADIYLAFRLQVLLPLPCRCFCPSLRCLRFSPRLPAAQLVGKFVVLSCIFGAAMPALYLLTAAFLTLVRCRHSNSAPSALLRLETTAPSALLQLPPPPLATDFELTDPRAPFPASAQVPLVDRFNLLRRLVPPARTRTTLARGVLVFVLPHAEKQGPLGQSAFLAQLAWDGRGLGSILQLRRPVGIRPAKASA